MAEKKDLKDRFKSLWLKGMKAVGNTAASIANNTRYKVDEVTIQNRRREVMNDLANKAYALWLKGEAFPEPMDKMLEELNQLDEQLNDMRAEKYASSVKTGNDNPETAECPEAEPESEPGEEPEEESGFAPEADSQVSAEINELFDGAASVGKTAEKVNQSLEQLSDRIRRFPQADGQKETEQRQE